MLAGLTETGRRFVNTWECDENAHMNVQFFFAHFQDAEAHFWISRGLEPRSAPAVLTHHVRFHKELRAADMTLIGSGLARGPGGETVLLHMMHDVPGDNLVAACFSMLRGDVPGGANMDLPAEAAPRSVAAAPAQARSPDQLAARGYAPTYRAVVRPAECSSGGTLLAQHIISRFTDGAGHFWEHAGLSKRWLEDNGYGRVAVESKLTMTGPCAAGDAVIVMSGLTGYGAKTISFRHFVLNAANGRCCAVGEVTGLAVDLASRRAVAWPADREAIFKSKLVSDNSG